MCKIEWLYTKKEVSMSTIKEIESELKIKFPQDFIECVIYNHGACVEPHLFKVEDKERVFSQLLSFELNSSMNIINTYNRIKEGLPKKVIPIASDPAGNFICFDYSKNVAYPTVVFWYHEISVAEDDLDEDELEDNSLDDLQREALAYICDSFTELINMLY